MSPWHQQQHKFIYSLQEKTPVKAFRFMAADKRYLRFEEIKIKFKEGMKNLLI